MLFAGKYLLDICNASKLSVAKLTVCEKVNIDHFVAECRIRALSKQGS